jgi:uncharacterized damage-inducible protein DinB
MDGLRYSLLHNSWATRQVIETCRRLTPEQMDATTAGAYGSLRETLEHIVKGEGLRLRALLAGSPADWAAQSGETPDLDTLAAWAADNERFWEAFSASPIDTDREFEVSFRGKRYRVRAGVLLVQVLHHGNAHRDQMCAIMTALGLEPPEVSAWGYAGAGGFLVELSSAEAASPAPGDGRT